MPTSRHSASLSATAAASNRSAQVSTERLQFTGSGLDGMIVIEINFKIPNKIVIVVRSGR
jgi:hypothetical protein